jgi:hypothetical protein
MKTHITVLVTRILRYLLDFLNKLYTPVLNQWFTPHFIVTYRCSKYVSLVTAASWLNQ